MALPPLLPLLNHFTLFNSFVAFIVSLRFFKHTNCQETSGKLPAKLTFPEQAILYYFLSFVKLIFQHTKKDAPVILNPPMAGEEPLG
jgi:hypothetical protein